MTNPDSIEKSTPVAIITRFLGARKKKTLLANKLEFKGNIIMQYYFKYKELSIDTTVYHLSKYV